MARITVEDCLDHVANRFELVILAAKRARQLMRGSADPTVPWENDKATVVALREIASGHTDFSDAHEIDMMPRAASEEIHVDIHDEIHEDIHEDIHEETHEETSDHTDTDHTSSAENHSAESESESESE